VRIRSRSARRSGVASVAARVLVAALLVAPIAASSSSAAASGPLPPGKDPFYAYSGAEPLRDVPPGTVLKTRSVDLAFGTHPTHVQAEQLLYRTTDELGEPAVTVTTVLEPVHVPVAPRLVGYLSFYDGLGAQCDPSYTLAGGNGGSAIEQQAEEEELLISWYLTNDFIVTVPDFEGTGLHWMAGQESGYGTLDALRATESYLHLGSSTPIGLSGYSGGAVAADWASELAPAYAPALHIVGVAEGGIPVDYAHLLAYINGVRPRPDALPLVVRREAGRRGGPGVHRVGVQRVPRSHDEEHDEAPVRGHPERSRSCSDPQRRDHGQCAGPPEHASVHGGWQRGRHGRRSHGRG
jgi:Secretory lipase